MKNWWASDTSLKDNAMEASDATDSFVRNHAGVSDQVRRPVTLGELARVCEPLLSRRIKEDSDLEDGSLNPVLFNRLRRWAYRERRHFNDFPTWCAAVLMQACHYNAEGTTTAAR